MSKSLLAHSTKMAGTTSMRQIKSSQRVRFRQASQQAVTVLFIFCLLYFLLPISWLVFSATKTNSELFTTFGLWFTHDFHLFPNLSELFTYNGGVYLTWLWNTCYYSVTSALGATLLAALGGYTFAKFHFWGRNVIFSLILGSILVPTTALAIPLYLVLSHINLINTPFAVILPSLVSPFGIYLMRIYADQALPDELLDAARMDGAGEIRIFSSIALRILMPGVVTVLLFTFVSTWNNYFLPLLVLSQPGQFPLTVGLASWNAQASANGAGAQALFTLVLTGALVAIIPLIAAFLFLQRYWQSGLTFGSVKA